MGREMRRKENKKNKKLIEKKEVELDTSISGLTALKVVGAIVIILLVLYFILAIFVTKELAVFVDGENPSATETNTSGVSNKVLASSIFNQKEESYYVYFYDFTDEDEMVANAISSKSDITIYRVDTSSSLNRKYVTEESGNASATGLNDLKVKNPTLIQVTGDKIIAYYEGSSKIIEFFNK